MPRKDMISHGGFEDHERISFITSAETFCYMAMPFGLMNGGASYQCLVDKKVYMDDMLCARWTIPRVYGNQRGIEANPIKFKAILDMKAPTNISEDSGTSIVITSPQGDDKQFAIRFEFKASNNKVEYEVLIIGMGMAHEVGARRLIAYSDSQLIVKQIEGMYEVKEENMVPYQQ
ncbi:hypothetical protein Sango_1750400 [Sesamum angolense]|uniref:RNase H type-1 domain-containing protein n=1 Tax=Sesamum angolense TaxID=2727404 RepID=A0AAE2BSB1_9LAMI|nr:hypothetical protein Sango_1750400 [Sesamum angolense]